MKHDKNSEKKCTRGAHRFFDSLDPWYEKCQYCPAVRKKESIKIKYGPSQKQRNS